MAHFFTHLLADLWVISSFLFICLFFTITNKAAMNTQVQILAWMYTFVSHGKIPRSGMAKSLCSCLTF